MKTASLVALALLLAGPVASAQEPLLHSSADLECELVYAQPGTATAADSLTHRANLQSHGLTDTLHISIRNLLGALTLFAVREEDKLSRAEVRLVEGGPNVYAVLLNWREPPGTMDQMRIRFSSDSSLPLFATYSREEFSHRWIGRCQVPHPVR